MPAQKKFKLGNLKKYAAIVVAAVALNTAPAKIQAQDNKPKTENFDLKKASERDKALYNAITNVLEMKYSEEDAAAKAGQIMSKKTEFSQEQANNYIRFMVENFMGDEYREAMDKAKREVDGQPHAKQEKKQTVEEDTMREVQTDFGGIRYQLEENGHLKQRKYDRKALSEQRQDEISTLSNAIQENWDKHPVQYRGAPFMLAQDAIIENIIYQDIKERLAQGEEVPGGQQYMQTFEKELDEGFGLEQNAEGKLIKRDYDKKQENAVTQNKFGKEKKTVVANDSTVTTTIEEEKVFRMADLTPAERTEYNKMLNKIKAAYELRGKVSKNLINMQATHNAQVAFMSSSKEKLFEMAVRGIKFRDIDEKSFVAFNPENGEGKIVAPQNEMSRIQKQVKKAGGIENFVMEVQKKKSNAAPTKNAGKIPLISLDGNIH